MQSFLWVCGWRYLSVTGKKEKLQVALYWDPSCNLSAPKMKRLEGTQKKRRKKKNPSEIYTCHASTVLESHVLFSWAEELLPLKALYCYFKLWKHSALQFVFLTESTWRKLMLHLSLGVCSVFWKNVLCRLWNYYSFSGLTYWVILPHVSLPACR